MNFETLSSMKSYVQYVYKNHLDSLARSRMIGKLEKGRSLRSVVQELGMDKCVFTSLESLPNDVYSCENYLNENKFCDGPSRKTATSN